MAPWESLRGDPAIVRLRELADQVTEFAEEAQLDLRRFPLALDRDWATRVLNRVGSTFTIMVIGQVSSGKSSLLNSLAGRKLLKSSDQPTDGAISVLLEAEDGAEEYAELVAEDGAVERLASLGDGVRFLNRQETPAHRQLACREVRLHLHEPALRRLRLINTPGLGDRLQDFEQTTLRYLHQDESDLIVWTFFPDAAANRSGLGVFTTELARRRGAVLGVVTRCLEGHEDDPTYDPAEDASLKEVTTALRTHLGDYLRDVVLYDSHVARRLVSRLREQPGLREDPEFSRQLERCGYAALEQALREIVGDSDAQAQQARVRSLLRRCAATAEQLQRATAAAEQEFRRRGEEDQEQITAWERVKQEVIEPARGRLQHDLATLVGERSQELVNHMSSAAADAVQELTLSGSLGRLVAGWTPFVDKPAEALNKRIESEMGRLLERHSFYQRVDRAVEELVTNHLAVLQGELQLASISVSRGGVVSSQEVYVEPGRPGGAANVLLSDSLKTVVTKVLQQLLTKVEERVAMAAASRAAAQAASQVAAQTAATAGGTAGTAAASQAGRAALGATAARAFGAVTLLLAPLEIGKLVDDFKKNRERLVESVRARYQADRHLYEQRLLDALRPAADDSFNEILLNARVALADRSDVRRWQALEEKAANCRLALADLALEFGRRADA